MSDRRDNEYLAAFLMGAIIGVGATLLLKPERSTGQRILKELKPYRKKVSRARHVLKDELSDLVEKARREIASAARDQMKGARKAARRGVRRFK